MDKERAEMLAVIRDLLSWVDNLPVKHPSQSEVRERARRIVENCVAGEACKPSKGRSSTADDDPVDLQGCEHCGKEFPIETMTTMVDCWYCAGCYAEWKAIFDLCEHSWEPEQNEHGEPGKYCHKCAGFVTDGAS